jgi:uncharacterized protein with von Willebrand factor type A (vWA) domain
MHEIINFSNLLREKNIPVSIRSTQTACETYELFKDDQNVLNEALAAVYVKDKNQRSKFDKIFKSTFGDGKEESEGDKGSSEGDNSNKSKKFLKAYNYNFKIREPKVEIKINESDVTDYRPPLEEYLNPPMEENELLKKDIKHLTTFEPELLDLCQRLGKKIANKRVRRHKQSRNRHPDIRKTLRRNLKYGGALIDIVKTKPRIKKSKHFFLNDVSGSCDWVSNWFFCMVYAAQSSFKQARTFEFDNKTIETTDALTEPNILDAFIKVRDMRQKNLMIHGTSNMFKSFDSFKKQANLNNKSFVLILSDCRDWAGPKSDAKSGAKPLSVDIMEYIVDKSKKVLVLNPEQRNKWNVADSCVCEYEEVGAEFYEVRNLEQLADLISNI